MTALHPDTITALTALVDHCSGWLDKAGLTAEAAALRNLPAIDTTDAIHHAGPAAQAAMHAAYHRSGVIAWPQADIGILAVHASGGLAYRLDATRPYPHSDPMRGLLEQFSGWLWTAACYAAHAAVTGGRP